MPLYTGDYLRDTRHLTPLKHGVYILLLMHCWDQKGPLPLDEQECAGIANCRSADEIEAMRYVLQRYFTKMEDGFYNHRMNKEVSRSEAVSMARSDAGKRGYQAKAKQLLSKSQASDTTPTPTPILSPPSPQSPSEPSSHELPQNSVDTPTPLSPHAKKPRAPTDSKGCRLDREWQLPDDWRSWTRQEKPAWSEAHIDSIAAQFRDYWIAVPGQKGTKLDWEATWRNWVRKTADEPRLNQTRHHMSTAEHNRQAFAEAKRLIFGETK